MNTTQKDISRAAGVSRMTVYRALSGRSDVSEDTRKKVLNTIREEKYTPNAIARSLVLKRTKTLGMILPCITHSFFPKVTRSVEDKANERGYHIILCHNNGNSEKEECEINLLCEKRVDGMILVPALDRDTSDVYIELQNKHIPFVMMDMRIDNFDCNFVGTDDVTGAFEAVEHLIKLGHSKIAYLGGPPNVSTSRDRLKGYRKALEEYGIEFDPDLVIEVGFEEEDGVQAVKEILRRPKIPTAIFTVDDLVAIGVYFVLKDKGIRVPDDMALVGYAGLNEGRILEVPLTTVAQPVNEMGRTAAEMLIEIISKDNFRTDHRTRKVLLKPEVIVRKSCGAYLGRREQIC